MGAVYKARDRELDRLVALKVIRPELAGLPEILQRFKQELILARKVTHRNVIRIFDLGEAEGLKFITMEFIEGRDLKSLLGQEGKLSPDRAVEIIQQVCLALEAAHAEGVVHRDLKPQNIMLDQQGRASVMDFGIARSLELGGMTQTGAVMGTPEYMSPEQVRGEHVDTRSDLFTLGVIFQQLLTGALPYQAETAMASMFKRTKERAIPVREIDPAVPQILSDIVGKCLEIEPEHRFQSARELYDALEAWKGGAGAPLGARSLRWARRALRNRAVMGSAVAVLLVLLGGVVLRDRLSSRSPGNSAAPADMRSLAIISFRNASGDASLDWLGSSLANMLNTDIGQSAHLRIVSLDRIHQTLKDLRIDANADLDPDTLRRIAELSNADTVVWGQYAKARENIHIDANLKDLKRQQTVAVTAEAAGEDALTGAVNKLAQSIRGNLSLSSSALKEMEAAAFTPSSTSAEAIRDFTEGLGLARQGKNLEAQKALQAAVQKDPNFALAYSRLGQVDVKLGYESDAEAASRQAVQLSEKLPTPERYLILAIHAQIMKDYPKAIEAYENLARAAPGDSDVQSTLGGLYEDTGAFDKARDHYLKVTQAEPKNANALLAMGRVEVDSGNLDSGVDYFNRALALAIQFENQEQRALILQALGVVYRMLQKPDDALNYYQQALEIRRQLKDQLGIADSLRGIAAVEISKGQLAAALKVYLESIQIRREIGDKKGLGDTLIDLGYLYNSLGRYDDGLKAEKEALQIEHEAGDRSNEGLALNNIGIAYTEKSQYEDARTYFERALQLRQDLKVPQDIAQSLHNLGETSLNLGEFDPALKYYMQELEYLRTAGDQRGEAIDSDSLAILYTYQGQYGRALRANEDALKSVSEAHESGELRASIMADYGKVLGEAGRFEDAQKALDEALQVARQINNQADIARALMFRGDAFFYAGDFKSAERAYEGAVQAASQTSDRALLLQSKLNRAKLAVSLGRGGSVISTLKSLGQDADTLGLKYLSVDSSLYLAEALIQTHNYAQARTELERVLTQSEKMGLRGLLARGHFLMATALRLAGHTADSGRELEQARQILSDIRKEAGESVMKRVDFAAIMQQAS
jgi:tetratricopeptide (TPR) repeat protein